MPNEETIGVPEELIDDLNTFVKSYEYGCRMFEGLVERHLAGADIIPQIITLSHNDWVPAIFHLITTSDERAEEILRSDLIEEDSRRKLSDIRSKYCPILQDVLSVGAAVRTGYVNPVSSTSISQRYDRDDQTLYLDTTAYSGQREIFRVVQDASQLLDFALEIVRSSSDSFEWCQRQGLPLRKGILKRLESLQGELQKSSAKLSEVVQKFSTPQGKEEQIPSD